MVTKVVKKVVYSAELESPAYSERVKIRAWLYRQVNNWNTSINIAHLVPLVVGSILFHIFIICSAQEEIL